VLTSCRSPLPALFFVLGSSAVWCHVLGTLLTAWPCVVADAAPQGKRKGREAAASRCVVGVGCLRAAGTAGAVVCMQSAAACRVRCMWNLQHVTHAVVLVSSGFTTVAPLQASQGAG
jgi:hypothetical protein